EARRIGAIDAAEVDLRRGVAGAEVAVVCTPVTRIADDVRRVVEFGPDGLLVTDVGSTKRRIVEMVETHERARSAYVGGHPLAGSVDPELLPVAAGAYRDGTRVAGADGALWTGIFLENRESALDAVGAFQDQLSTFKLALLNRDENALRAWWESAKAHRLAFD